MRISDEIPKHCRWLRVGDRVAGMESGNYFSGTVEMIGEDEAYLRRDDYKMGVGNYIEGYGSTWTVSLNANTYNLRKLTPLESDTKPVGNSIVYWDKGITMGSINSDKQDEIPQKLSVMELVTASAEDKILIKAGYKKGGEYTQKAKDMAIVLFLETQQAKLVEIATDELKELE